MLPAARLWVVGLCNATTLLPRLLLWVILLLLLATALLAATLSGLRVLTLSLNHCETSTGVFAPVLGLGSCWRLWVATL
jgi:hypothetical protein